jgi:hypothetical protein
MQEKIERLETELFLNTDKEYLHLIATHFYRAEESKRLMRDAGFGVTGTDILETTKLLIEEYNIII